MKPHEGADIKHMWNSLVKYCRNHTCIVYENYKNYRSVVVHGQCRRLSGDCEIDEFCFGKISKDEPVPAIRELDLAYKKIVLEE
ncbi:MAG: hypothetical protein QMD85_02960 [Candidatus Aenigmarchaeota archaeon]|nr:hypothetical protein [Candidatus Aenigmarchaeota archaeon]